MLLAQIKLCTSCLTSELSIVKILTIFIFQGIRIIIPICLIIKAIINLGKSENKNSKEFASRKSEFANNLFRSTLIYLTFTFIEFGVNILADKFSANIWVCIKNLISF